MRTILVLGLLMSGGVFASDVPGFQDDPIIVIPPLAECLAEDANGTEFRGGSSAQNRVECELFGEEERMGCEKVLPAVNKALSLCQQKGNGECQITRCWENPQ